MEERLPDEDTFHVLLRVDRVGEQLHLGHWIIGDMLMQAGYTDCRNAMSARSPTGRRFPPRPRMGQPALRRRLPAVQNAAVRMAATLLSAEAAPVTRQ